MFAATLLAGVVSLEVAGEVESTEPLSVRLLVRNRGDAAAVPVRVAAEIAGHRRESRLEHGIAAGGEARLVFAFPATPSPPGVHALALHLRYPWPPGGTAWASQRAYLLLALGARPPAPVALSVAPASFEFAGDVAVTLESVDGAGHRARLRVLTPLGLNPFGEDVVVDVPAAGTVTARPRLLRGGAPRETDLGIVVLAEVDEGGQRATAAATGVVRVEADSAWLPRARGLVAAAGALLLLGAALAQWRAVQRDRAS